MKQKYKKKICPVCSTNECAIRNNGCWPCFLKRSIGRKLSESSKTQMSEVKMGELNPNWKGNNVGYCALHGWVKSRIPKPDICPQCCERKAMDLANKSGEYKRDLDDWEWLCRRCHMANDGRRKKLISLNKFRPKKVGCSSKYMGVTWNKVNKNWVAYINRKYIGAFADEEKAGMAYNEMAIKVFGKDAILNLLR